jgi:hypothetical protein
VVEFIHREQGVMATFAGETRSELKIVNPSPHYAKVRLVEPNTLGYILIGATVQRTRVPFVLPNSRRAELIGQLKEIVRRLKMIDGVVDATVFRAIVVPPTASFFSFVKERGSSIRLANFDVIILIQAISPAKGREIQSHPEYVALLDAVHQKAENVNALLAHNVKRIGDVDVSKQGLFLFNHFVAEDRKVMLELWEYLADWYVKETGLQNSVGLEPEAGQDSDYAIVNWARWDDSAPRHLLRSLGKRSFWTYIKANLEANRGASMPVYCRLA